MQKEFDPEKSYIIIEDNGDGSSTFVLNSPELDFKNLVMVIAMPLVDFIKTLLANENSQETFDEMNERMGVQTYIIPNEPDEL
jgi:hypothetical protein